MRIVVVGTDADLTGAVRGVLAAQFPDAACDTLDPARLRSKPEASVVIADGRADVERGLSSARLTRAMGFAGALVMVGAAGDAVSAEASRLGFALVAPDRLAHELVPAVAAELEASGAPLSDQVMRARRLVAAGEIALRLQHAINNPLAGLLAEAQLLQLEALPAEQKAAVDRMVGLCRRMVDLTRTLDGIGERKPAAT